MYYVTNDFVFDFWSNHDDDVKYTRVDKNGSSGFYIKINNSFPAVISARETWRPNHTFISSIAINKKNVSMESFDIVVAK